MKSFPNPLTPSEEKEYIQKYTEGDLQAKHILIERNLRLVAHVIKKYQYVDEDPEDLISIGTIGLIKAIVTFRKPAGSLCLQVCGKRNPDAFARTEKDVKRDFFI